MLKKTITYQDLRGNDITEDFYFHISESEAMKMELRVKGGLKAKLEDMVANAEEHPDQVIDTFEWFIEKSYGVRSSDGKSFNKDPELFKAFKESDAYNKLFISLITDTNVAIEFTNGIMPQVSDKPAPGTVPYKEPHQVAQLVEDVPAPLLVEPDEFEKFQQWQAEQSRGQAQD